MKKLFFLSTVVCFIIFSASCSKAQDPDNLFEMSEPELQEMAAAETESDADFELSADYSYGNMQKNAPPGDFMDDGEQILFTASPIGGNGQLLYTFDKATEEVSLLCKDATCLHNSIQCVSANAMTNLEQYNGTIYGMTFMTGQIMELKNGKFESVGGGAVNSFWHANNNLYAVSKDRSLIVFENNSKEPRVLIDEYTDYWNVVFGRYLYGCSAQGVHRVDLQAPEPQAELIVEGAQSMTDGHHIYYVDLKNYYLYRCNMDGSDSEQLTEQSIMPASLNFDEEYLYFRLYTDFDMAGPDSHDVYRLSKTNPESPEKIIELPTYAYQIFTVPNYDKIFVVAHDAFEQGSNVEYYIAAKDGSSVKLLEFPEF